MQPEKFDPPITLAAEHLRAMKGARFMKYTQNPSKITYKNGNYAPRLTITTRKARKIGRYPIDIDLKIEFSAPKLLFQNNLDELADLDFESVVNILHTRLMEMGVFVKKQALIEAQVRAVHFSKNIPLTDFYTASLAIKELYKLDVNKRLDINKRHFQNSGNALYFDCNSYAMVFYDKLEDGSKTQRHSVDKEKTAYQLKLFESFKKSKEPLEVLRYELRITKKQKLNSLMKEATDKENPTFKDVFNSDLSKKLLLKHWKIIYPNENRFVLQFEENNLDKTFESIVNFYKQSKKRITVKDAFSLLGIITFSKSLGIRDLRNRVSSVFSQRTWFRAKKLFETANLLFKNNKSFGFVKDIEDGLKLFAPFKAKDLSYTEGAIS
jgi:hypothetical protein